MPDSSPMTGSVPLAASKDRPLTGWRVLVPRGGPWGDTVAAMLRSKGASPVVAPLINFAATDQQAQLEAALVKLANGYFDWLTVTSATTVDVLRAHGAIVPTSTKIAAVGETTAAALVAAGYRADISPSENNTSRGMLEEWQAATGGAQGLRVLALRSAVAEPVLSTGLPLLGHEVTAVVAYRTVGIPVAPQVREDLLGGAIQAVVISSGSVAEQVFQQFGVLDERVVVACIGPQTAHDAERAGLRVDLVAEVQTMESLIEALGACARARGMVSQAD
ncbi:MAG TPA: uroporphyrinogen-III synthase [Microbacteriaceae bacterium]|nr:uroporphyrinogen-III synthase [Microbacteriaceae bacterium]